MDESGTIDVGIDLGTTNSAVVLVEDGTPTVIKNNDGWDTTPSAVWLPKPGVIHVGRRARERVESDPANAAAEFKLEMGLADAKRTFARAGVELTPRQLSAEVLKSLRNDVRHHTGTAPEVAVITVPAAFTLNQNKDTAEAAALAGFHPACPLVQEPTAAAFAYGFSDATERAYWMVFDFGGGTFDAAVVSKRDGDLRVLNHAGDSYLGGKLIDWALIERVLAPAVARELGIAEFRRDNPAQRANFAKLKHAAEEAKIQLSRRDEIEIMVDLTGPGGGTEPFEYLLRRDELDRIAEPFYVRAINLCRNALADAALRPEDIDRLLLVGGVTLSPGLRERLADPADGLGIELDTSLDPTTVVARGAAIFAGTVRRPAPRRAASAPGEFTAELIYEPSVTTTTPTVGGRLSSSSTVDWTGYSVVLSNPGGRPPFRSARIPLSATGAFLTEVDLDPGRTSRFTIELTDATGTRRELRPDTLSITHREVEFGGVRLAHSLGIQLDDRAFAPMLRKGATLPARVREVFRTSRALNRSDDESVIRIPVVQGERSRGDRNREVGMLEIRPRDVRIDLPAGSEVEVTFEVDTSSLVTVVADVPLVQAQFEAEIDLDNVRTAEVGVLRERLSEVETRLEGLRAMARGAEAEDARRRLERLDGESAVTTARDQVGAASVDAGAAAAAEERLRDLQAELDDIEEAVELPVLADQLGDAVNDAIALARQSGLPGHLEEAEDLRRRADEAVSSKDTARVRAELERIGQFVIGLERRSPDWPVRLFYTLQELLPASGQVTALVAEGRTAIAANNVPALEAVNQRLIRLLPQEEQQKVIGVVRG
ncbi:Hsp70 family protein [Amycolatopsis cynarae]|uniref:Hsp70 family protein n=1 Tax=Amycolatopsis cynarae TaxID=2995223 RepID=A0ABY7AY36_9PSEU|nr:Hsp70 family protein [Amycolatopsis sp. HUAS 11-8]WAL64634.1 Hsp70 family protein [Amycolatopsis sp. HUAS 11-8]